MKGRKILVTGSNGFLARETIRQLYNKGANVVATSLEDRPFYTLPPNTKYAQANITDRNDMMRLFKGENIDDIVHHAALFSLSAGHEALHQVNVVGTKNILEAAIAYDAKRAVVTSSGTVYKSGTSQVKENGELGPCEVYGQSKLEQELESIFHMGATTKSGKLRVGIVRPAVIMGPESKYGGQVALFTHYLMGSLFLGMSAVPGDGTAELCFVHVEDCAGLHLHMLENDLVSDNANNHPEYIFNSVDDYPITNNELADLVVDELNLPKWRSVLKGKKLPLPEKPLKWLAQYNDKLINWLKKSEKPVPTVSLDSGSVELMYAGHVSMSTEKAKESGFEHKHPDGRVWLREIVQGNIASNWENLLGKRFGLLTRHL